MTDHYVKELKDQGKTAVFVISLILYAIISTIFATMGYNSISNNSIGFMEMSKNWETRPIVDITVEKNCPYGYEEATRAYWPGTTQGCYCGNVSPAVKNAVKINSDYIKGKCNFTLETYGCRTSGSYSARELTHISEIDGHSVKLCIKRGGMSWVNILSSNNGYNCNGGGRKCGSSPDFSFCTSGECPITDISIQKNSIYSSEFQNCSKSNGCIIFSKTGSEASLLKFKRGDEVDSWPVAQLRLNEHGMCKDSNRDNVSPNKNQFPFLNRISSSCNQEGNQMWNVTYTLTEDQLFKLNNMTSIINSFNIAGGYYPQYGSGSLYQWHLFSRDYVPWKNQCRGSMQQVFNSATTIASIQSSQGWLLFIVCVSAFILGIIFPCMLCGNYSHSTRYGHVTVYHETTRHERKPIRACGACIGHITKLIQIPFILYSLLLTRASKNFFQQISTFSCSEPSINDSLRALAHGLENCYMYNMLNLIVLIIVMIIGVLISCRKNIHMINQELNSDNSTSYQTTTIVQPVVMNYSPSPGQFIPQGHFAPQGQFIQTGPHMHHAPSYQVL